LTVINVQIFYSDKAGKIPEDYQPMVAKINCPGALMIAIFFNDFSETFIFW
jgi:hypothetical protein